MDESAKRLTEIYGKDDLSANDAFAGGFINAGYWRDISSSGEITIDERTRSQQDLYRLVLSALEVDSTSQLLEVGCGRGLGSALALREYAPASVCAIDLHEAQIERAQHDNAALLVEVGDRLSYQTGSATEIPFADGQFDCIFSVEVAQHIRDTALFSHELRRVMRRGGRLSLVTFFANEAGRHEELVRLFPALSDGTDNAPCISVFFQQLNDAGFTKVCFEKIGQYVWQGWDSWLSQTAYHDKWPRNFLLAYQSGLLDYYIVTGIA